MQMSGRKKSSICSVPRMKSILFQKLVKKSSYHTSPVEHIYQTHAVKLPYYEDLYENQMRQDSEGWLEFKKELGMPCTFHDDLREINTNVEILCLWFFRERSDRDKGADLFVSPGKDKKVITYNPNTLFIIDTKHEIKLKERTPYFPRRPCLQIEMTPEIYVNIKKELEINE
jgi:hypothetical protein